MPLKSSAVGVGDLRRAKSTFRELRERIGHPVPSFEFHAPARWSVGTVPLFAADGALWVRNGRSGDDLDVWTVFPASGSRPEVLGLPSGFKLLAATRERLYGAWTTSEGAQVVRVYRRR